MPTASSHCSAARGGKARKVVPGARRPTSDRRHSRPSRKGVGSSVKTSASGVLAGLVAAIALAAPALGAPANVTVRVEGESATVLPRSAVTTDTAPVLVQGDDA